jgi:hypothetical protein
MSGMSSVGMGRTVEAEGTEDGTAGALADG